MLFDSLIFERRRELFHQLFLFVRRSGGHINLDAGDQVAGWQRAAGWYAPAAKAHLGTARCAGRNRQRHFAIERFDVNLRTQDRLCNINVNVSAKVAPDAIEYRMRPHTADKKQITARSAVAACTPASLQANLLTILDTRGHFDFERFAPAQRWIVKLNIDFDLRTLDRLLKTEVDGPADVGAGLGRALLAIATPTENAFKRIPPSPKRAKQTVQIFGIELRTIGAPGVNLFPVRIRLKLTDTDFAKLVVLSAFLFIAQHRIGVLNLFEFGFSRRIVAIAIGVEFLGKLAIGLFDLRVRRFAINA